jgi:hypothetical protein
MCCSFARDLVGEAEPGLFFSCLLVITVEYIRRIMQVPCFRFAFLQAAEAFVEQFLIPACFRKL